jgi:hypothetical protein
MNKMKKFKGIYLMIAFAIFWISFASIIQFHLSKIHGEDLTATVVFVKSADQHSLVKNPKVFHHSDLNDGILLVDEKDSHTLYNLLRKTRILLKSESISHLCIEIHSLRGPPTL